MSAERVNGVNRIRLPKSSRQLMIHLVENGPGSPKELSTRTGVPLRTVSFALRKLRERGIVKRFYDFDDLRTPKYFIDDEKSPQIIRILERMRNA